MTASGPMREVISIQQRSSTRDDAGEPLLQWTEVLSRRAEKVATPGREVWGGDQRNGRVPTVFRIRYPHLVSITPAMRVVHRDVVFDIKSCVDPDGRRVDLVLTCEELVGEPS